MFKGLWLKNYRNFSEVAVAFSPKINIFLGENGQGKTNLLEALYICSRGYSFRYSENENLISKGTSEAVIKAKLIQNELEYDLQIQVLKSKKNVLLNQKRVPLTELQKIFPTVLFSPESLAAIKEGADVRRDLIDDLVGSVQPQALSTIVDFRKALRSRNKILKNFLNGEADRNETIALLESITPLYLNLALEVTLKRLNAISEVLGDFNSSMKAISKSNSVDISVEYVISGQNALNMTPEEIKKSLNDRVHQLRDAELASGVSLVGPQKHDVIFLYNENDSRFYCSQGQQRALILALKMAQIVYHRRIHGSYPVLLLDDVLSELDAEKRDSLIRFLNEINTQIFITTTDFTLPQNMRSDDCAVTKLFQGTIC